jgi:hypothetical protein
MGLKPWNQGYDRQTAEDHSEQCLLVIFASLATPDSFCL